MGRDAGCLGPRVWRPATAPHDEPPPRPVVEVVDALVTGFDRGRLRMLDQAQRWMTGAVHTSEGALVPASQRLWAGDAKAPIAADPPRVLVPDDLPRLTGRWLYGGHMTRHFGHFLVESVTNLWPDPTSAGVEGLLWHRSPRGSRPDPAADQALHTPRLAGWQGDLLALAGYGGLPLRIVKGGAVRVDELVVPARPVLLKSFAGEEAVRVWDRIARSAPAPEQSPRRVFLSRRGFHAAGASDRQRRSGPAWDAFLDEAFALAGFVVVAPETLPVREQVALVRGAEVIAGPSGSGLHLSALARSGTRVLEVGDARSPTAPMPTQRLIDAARGHLTAFTPYDDRAALARLLAELG